MESYLKIIFELIAFNTTKCSINTDQILELQGSQESSRFLGSRLELSSKSIPIISKSHIIAKLLLSIYLSDIRIVGISLKAIRK